MANKRFFYGLRLTVCLLLSLTVIGHAKITLEVFWGESSEKLEPIHKDFTLVYPDIMTGSQLIIIISSDTSSNRWEGELYISVPYKEYGQLNDYIIFEAAGNGAQVHFFDDSISSGFSFYGGTNMTAGDWFAVDYNATEQGQCLVGFFEGIFTAEPTYILSFNHVRTRDFNDDGIVNFKDFAIFAAKWNTYCDTENCEQVDLDDSQFIDLADLELMTQFWLHKTR